MKFWATLVLSPWGKIHFCHFCWDSYYIKFHNFVNSLFFLHLFKYCLAKFLKSHLNNPILNTQDL